MIQFQLFENLSGARFSPCRTWRYSLWRRWDPARPMVMFIGLNPSTADESIDDPTIRRCKRFAMDFGYGGMYMLNAYAYRATEPKDMKRAADPVGPGNYQALREFSKLSSLVIAAWGVHCSIPQAVAVLSAVNRKVYCLGKTKDNCPKHPLYLKADTKPELFWEPATCWEEK